MSLDIEILRTLATRGRLSEITNHLMTLPHAQRADAIETIQPGISRRLSTRLNYFWPLYARDSQLPPDGDWDTWLILAGRGFGKDSRRCRVGPRSEPAPYSDTGSKHARPTE